MALSIRITEQRYTELLGFDVGNNESVDIYGIKLYNHSSKTMDEMI